LLRRLVLAIAALLVLGAGAAVAATQIRLNGGLGLYGNWVGVPLRIGAPFSIGMGELNAGHRVRIESVRLDHPTRGVVLVGSVVHSPGDGGIGSDRGFPPASLRALTRAADGVVLPAHTAVELVVGIRATELGAFRVHGVDVLYRERWHGIDVRRRAHVGIEVGGCAVQTSARNPGCRPPQPIG
jgi:hypothetical protein